MYLAGRKEEASVIWELKGRLPGGEQLAHLVGINRVSKQKEEKGHPKYGSAYTEFLELGSTAV